MNRKWVLLTGAVVAEVAGTLALRATIDWPALAAVVIVAYATAYYLLALALRAGMPIGAAYGIWGALGVALVTLLGTVVFGESLSAVALLGIGVIIAGVALVETGSRPVTVDQPADIEPGASR